MSYREFTEWLAFFQLENEKSDPDHNSDDLDVDDQVIEAFKNISKR